MKKNQNVAIKKKFELIIKNQKHKSNVIIVKINSAVLFLLEKITGKIKTVTNDLLTDTAFQQLNEYKIYKGSLLRIVSTHGMTTRQKVNSVPIRSFFHKDNFIFLMDFIVLKSEFSEFVPSINMWFVVLYNNNICYVDAFEFISLIKTKYIVHATT